ncbi:MAG: YhdP family protein [Gammaproteobacteria bacterium]|nr:YhdP family protein [Gammaproteobacteria bacterium]
MNSFFKFFRIVWYLSSSIIIVFALLVSVTRELTPTVNKHREEIENYASNLIQHPVTIGHIQLGWHHLAPEILINSVIILDEQTHKAKLGLQKLEIDLSFFRSLWAWQIIPKNIVVSGVDISIYQRDFEKFNLDKLGTLPLQDTLTGSELHTDQIVAWIFSQPRLGLKDINIRYIETTKKQKSLTLMALDLRNTSSKHDLQGRVTLNQEVPTKVDVKLVWNGDLVNIKQAKASLYLYVRGLTLTQWFSDIEKAGFKIKNGLISSKIWIDFDNGEMQKIQSRFQVYGLELYSVDKKRTEEFSRISANVGWKRNGNVHTIAADQVFIDFPDHIWPTTNFSVVYQVDSNNAYTLKFLNSGYVDLVDASRIMLLSTLLTDDNRKMILDFSPKGVLKFIQINFLANTFDLSNTILSAQFANIDLLSNMNLPAINNLSGNLKWDGKAGTISSDSNRVSLTFENVFLKPLRFDNLTADITFQKNTTNDWLIHANTLHVKNDDVDASVKGDLTLTQNDSPLIDLSGNFQLDKAVHVANYLPLKLFDASVSKWVEHAFLAGKGESGTVLVQGKFKDFPFENQTGKFLISTKMRNVDLDYADGWPILRDMQGDLIFDGDTMKTVVASGSILDIPINNVAGEILNIGKQQPSLLTVKGNIQSDFSEGLRFIQASPLRNALGKQLSGLKLTGDMNLQLSLVVPLSNPEKTEVLGEAALTKAMLSVPEWKIALSQLEGDFKFTQNSLEAHNIKGVLLSKPILLNITTVPVTQQIQASFSSNTSIADLESLLQISLQKYVQGNANYTAKLLISSHTGSSESELVIESDLKGITINLPDNYGKQADTTQDFKLEILLNTNPLLKTKLHYDNLLSAALSYKKIKSDFELVSGEIKLGGQEANWQKEPGILISGNMAVLDTTTWQKYFDNLNIDSTKKATDYKFFRGIELNAEKLNIFGYQLNHASIKAHLLQSIWQLELQSQEVGGQISLPFPFTHKFVSGQFDHFYISDEVGKSEGHIDPRTLPELTLDLEDIRYAGKEIGHVILSTVPSSQGLTIKQLSLDDPLMKLSASGDWILSGDHYETHLQGNVSTPKLSDILNRWGFSSENLEGSTGQANFDLTWHDAPYTPSLTGLSGHVSLNLGKGVITHLSESSNAKIGLGRLLNVFSLSSIPRRLSLDFSDLAQKGYNFDYIKGDFDLKNSNAVTNNLKFDGPIAAVSIAGRIGLAAKDFNMKLSVTPYMTSSLPVVAAFAGGPIVGAAAWMVDKVVSTAVSSASTYQYSVTGSWANPVWTPLSANHMNRSQ